MPADPRAQRQRTDDWDQLRLLVATPEQEPSELLRPVVLFGQSARSRARETGAPERSLRRKAARFAALGMRSLFDLEPEPAQDRRRRPLAIRRAIVELKAEHPPCSRRELAAICHERFDRPVDHHTVKQVLRTEPLPLRLPRRFPRYHEIADPVARRKAIVDLYLEGWRAVDRRLPGDVAGARLRHPPSLGGGRSARPGRSRAGPAPAGAQGRSESDGGDPSLTSQPRARGVPDPCGAGPAGDSPLPAHRRPHPGAPPRLGGAQAGDRRVPGAPADAVRRPTPAPVLVGRHPLRRRPCVGDRQAGLRHLHPRKLQPCPPGQRDLVAPRPDRRSDRPARRSKRMARPRRSSATAAGCSRPTTPRRSPPRSASPTARSIAARRGRTTASRTATSCAAWPIITPRGRRAGRNGRRRPSAFALTTTSKPTSPILMGEQERTAGRHSPAAVLDWVQGAGCDPADRDRRFRRRATRVLNAGGYVRFRHWRLYGARGLAGSRVAVWLGNETVTKGGRPNSQRTSKIPGLHH